MVKKGTILILLVMSFVIVNAQKLIFNDNEEFKIVQFTDVHYAHNNQKSDTALLVIQRVLDAEKPDLVVFTGDVVVRRPAKEGWDAITKLVIDRKIPFAVNMGNHDEEHDASRADLEKIITAYPFNVNTPTSGMLSGIMNNVIPIYGSKKQLKVQSLIYCFDSGDYSTINDVGGWGWIATDIIEWYKKQSYHYFKLNNYETLPALAYFHIPLPEYKLAFDDENNKRFGERKEKECGPQLNTGMFFAMKEMKDVMATFTGHDHVNNYIVNYYDVALAYGQFSGWRTTYHPELNGARVVVLKEGKREFDTWIRLLDGTIKDKITYPADLVSEKKKK